MSDSTGKSEVRVEHVGLCPLTPRQQLRNVALFGFCQTMIYISAPVSYVGVLQGPLCKELGANAFLANLPATVNLSMNVFPVLLAWYLPFVSALRRNIVLSFGIASSALALAAVVLAIDVPNSVKIAAVILHAAASGAFMTAAIGLMWEVLGRGTDQKWRGLALALGFGAGPFFAFAASLGSQLLLSGQIGPWQIPVVDKTFLIQMLEASKQPASASSDWIFYIDRAPFSSPWNYQLHYALAAPMLGLAALMATRFIVPMPDVELKREPFSQSVLGGLKNFVRSKVLLIAAVVTMLLYAGNNVGSNMSMYLNAVMSQRNTATLKTTDKDAEKSAGTSNEKKADFSGIANAMRFAFKGVAGILLGWLLAKTNPKAGMLVTGSIFACSQIYGIFAQDYWYLLSFGLMGVGELIGVYAPNYMLSASRKSDMRRNMAFVMMLSLPVAPMGLVFGGMADRYADPENPGNLAAMIPGFQQSFILCAAMILLGLLLTIVFLPKRPQPE